MGANKGSTYKIKSKLTEGNRISILDAALLRLSAVSCLNMTIECKELIDRSQEALDIISESKISRKNKSILRRYIMLLDLLDRYDGNQ